MEKIYLDTFVFMDLLAGNEFSPKAVSYLEQIKSGKYEGIVSAVLLSELAFHVKRRKGTEKAEEILCYIQALPNLRIVPISGEIAKQAGLLRARYIRKIPKTLTYFDSIHLATAISENCARFVTGDRGFRDIKEIKMEIY